MKWWQMFSSRRIIFNYSLVGILEWKILSNWTSFVYPYNAFKRVYNSFKRNINVIRSVFDMELLEYFGQV